MKQQINRIQIIKYKELVETVLSDFAELKAGKDFSPEKKIVLAAVFNSIQSQSVNAFIQSVSSGGDFNEIMENSYFPRIRINETQISAISERKNQINFLESMRLSVLRITFNMLNPELLIPTISNDNDPSNKAVFSKRQDRLVESIIVPSIIAHLESSLLSQENKKEALISEEVSIFDISKNEYSPLEDGILVMGEDGEFNVVLTKEEILEIIDRLRQFPSESHLKAIELVLARSGKKPLLTEKEELIPFSNIGFSQIKNYSQIEIENYSYDIFSFERAILLRQGYAARNSYFIHSSGGIIPAMGEMRIIVPGSDHDMLFDASSVGLDSSGRVGNNAVFFVTDIREDEGGSSYVISINLPEVAESYDYIHYIRPSVLEDNQQFDFSIPEARLLNSSLPDLIKRHTLRELYDNAKSFADHDKAKEKAIKPHESDKGNLGADSITLPTLNDYSVQFNVPSEEAGQNRLNENIEIGFQVPSLYENPLGFELRKETAQGIQDRKNFLSKNEHSHISVLPQISFAERKKRKNSEDDNESGINENDQMALRQRQIEEWQRRSVAKRQQEQLRRQVGSLESNSSEGPNFFEKYATTIITGGTLVAASAPPFIATILTIVT